MIKQLSAKHFTRRRNRCAGCRRRTENMRRQHANSPQKPYGEDELRQRLSRMGTVTCVDYLRPEQGNRFTTTSNSLLRAKLKWPSPHWNYTMKISCTSPAPPLLIWWDKKRVNCCALQIRVFRMDAKQTRQGHVLALAAYFIEGSPA